MNLYNPNAPYALADVLLGQGFIKPCTLTAKQINAAMNVTSDVKPSPLACSVENLSQAVVSLFEVLSTLTNRLGPVCVDPSPQCEAQKEKTQPPSLSPIVHHINTQVDRLVLMSVQVRDLIERLQV